MIYNEIAVESAFEDHIQKFWLLDNSNSPVFTEGKYALPNGCFTIACVSGEGLILESKNSTINVTPGIYFAGQISEKTKITLSPCTKAVMIQLKPWVPALITNFPLAEAANRVLDLSLINKKLYNALMAIDFSDQEAVRAMFYRELSNYIQHNNNSSFVKSAFYQFQVNGVAFPSRISDVATQLGCSVRRVEQKFAQLIGLSPKEVQKILQLRSLITELSIHHDSSLSYLTHKYGYYDQSHFIKSYSSIMYEQPARFESVDYILPFR